MTRAAAVVRLALFGTLALIASCLETSAVTCADGRLCPAGTQCDDQHQRCVFPDQLASCAGMPDEAPCPIGGGLGRCLDQVCLRESCGDGRVTGSEQCDGPIPGGLDCTDLGYYQSGPVGCAIDCTYDRSACAHLCGDQVIDLGHEVCDGDAPAAATSCRDLGYYDDAPLACNSACRYDTSACTGTCGDGVRNGPEACEGAPPPGLRCAALGYDGGIPGCSSLCAADLAGCQRFGWALESSTDSREDLVVVGDDAIAVGERIERLRGGDWNVDDQGLSHAPLHGVWAAGPTAIFAVGEAGTILRFDGASWAPMTAPTTAPLFGVWGRSATDVYAVGEGIVLHYDGTVWIELATLVGALRAIGGTPDDLWVAGDLVHHYDGVGWTWEADIYPEAVNSVAVLGPDDVLFGAGDGGLYRRTPTGWTQISAAQVLDLVVFGPDQIAVASGTGVRFYDGAGWIAEPVSTARLTALAGRGPGGLIAIDALGFSFRSDGVSVARQPTGVVADLHAVWSQGGAGFAVGSDGAIVAMVDGRWATAATPAPTAATLRGIWGSGADQVVAVGDDGTIVRFDGTSWSLATSGTSATLRAVWGSGPADVYLVGDDGVRHGDGQTWSPVTVGPAGAAWTDVWGTAADDVYVTGAAGTFHWNGSGWQIDLLPGGGRLDGAPTSGGPVVAVVAQLPFTWWQTVQVGRGGAVRTIGGVDTFQRFKAGPVAPQPRVLDLAMLGPGDGFATLDTGALVHYDGVAWTEVRTGLGGPARGLAEDGATLWLVGDDGAIVRLSRWSAPAGGCAEAGAERACADGTDDDCDLLTDDRDPDCHAAGVCWAAPTLGCGETLARTAGGGHQSIATTSCSANLREGLEIGYRLAAVGSATVTVTGAGDPLSVYVVGETAAGACDPAGPCLGAGVLVPATQTTTVTTDVATARYVVVEGAGPHTISVTCP